VIDVLDWEVGETLSLKGQCPENFRPFIESIGLYKQPLTGLAIVRPLKAKE